ncbi:hypothetical protein X975_02557, partial [Stegodyphus mimosarum]
MSLASCKVTSSSCWKSNTLADDKITPVFIFSPAYTNLSSAQLL